MSQVIFQRNMNATKFAPGSPPLSGFPLITVTPTEIVFQGRKTVDRLPRNAVSISYKKGDIDIGLLIVGIVLTIFLIGIILILIALLNVKDSLMISSGAITYKIVGNRQQINELMNALGYTPSMGLYVPQAQQGAAPTAPSLAPSPSPLGQQGTVIIKERVMVRCSYCGALNEQGSTKCQVCGAHL